MKDKKIMLLLVLVLFFTTAIHAQVVKQKDKYGLALVYQDGLSLKAKDKYGQSLYYIDGQTIRVKNK